MARRKQSHKTLELDGHTKLVPTKKAMRTKPTNIKQLEKVRGTFPLATDPKFLELTPKQQAFVHNVFLQPVSGWTNAKVYRVSHGIEKTPQNSSTTVHSGQYWKLLRHPKIEPFIHRIKKHYANKLGVTAERILREEATIAFSDIAQFFDSSGHLLVHPSKLPAKVRRAISSVKAVHNKNGSITYEVQLWNKGAALQRLENLLGMNAPQKHEVSGPDGGPIEISARYDFSILSVEEKRTLHTLLIKCKRE